jgi:hypothetical protein
VGVEKLPALPPTDEKGRRPELGEHRPNLSPHDTLLLAYAKLAFIALWQIGSFYKVHFRLPISLPTRFRRDFETYEENEPGKQNELALYAMEKTLPDIRVNVEDMEGLSDLKNHLLPLTQSYFTRLRSAMNPMRDASATVWLGEHAARMGSHKALGAERSVLL